MSGNKDTRNINEAYENVQEGMFRDLKRGALNKTGLGKLKWGRRKLGAYDFQDAADQVERDLFDDLYASVQPGKPIERWQLDQFAKDELGIDLSKIPGANKLPTDPAAKLDPKKDIEPLLPDIAAQATQANRTHGQFSNQQKPPPAAPPSPTTTPPANNPPPTPTGNPGGTPQPPSLNNLLNPTPTPPANNPTPTPTGNPPAPTPTPPANNPTPTPTGNPGGNPPPPPPQNNTPKPLDQNVTAWVDKSVEALTKSGVDLKSLIKYMQDKDKNSYSGDYSE